MYPIGNSFVILETVDSTNNYAMGKVHAGLAQHGDVYFTLAQTAGKGQRGRSWNSGQGENITISCVIEPTMFTLATQFMLSITIALGCYDFVNHYTRSETSIKWPNDIYWRDRKAGGILIENSILGNAWQFAVAGIGLNINQTHFPGNLINPVSLKQITGKTYDVTRLAKELCGFIQNRMVTVPLQNHLEEYNTLLYKKEQKVTLKTREGTIETMVKGVNAQGQLITFNNKETLYNHGEAEWVHGFS